MAELKEMILANKPPVVPGGQIDPRQPDGAGAMMSSMMGASGMMPGGMTKSRSASPGMMGSAMTQTGGSSMSAQAVKPATTPALPTASGSGDKTSGQNLANTQSGNPQTPPTRSTEDRPGRSDFSIGDGAPNPASADTTDSPILSATGILQIAASRAGDRVAAANVGGRWRTYRPPQGVKVRPVPSGPSGLFVALDLEGEEIPEVAVFSGRDGQWHTVKLEIPAKQKLNPISEGDLVVYLTGDRLYTFDGSRWNTHTFELGGRMFPIRSNTGRGLSFRDTKHLYLYNRQNGRWEPFDWEDIEASEKKAEKNPESR
jgi:hypothetical protein